MNRLFSLLFFLLLLPAWARRRKDGNPTSRGIVVMNRSGVKIDFYWVHPNTGELAGSNTDGGLVHGAESSINSYIGHTFEVHELARKTTGKCVAAQCMKTRFTVSANEDQIYTIGENFAVDVQDHKTRARKKAQESLKDCHAHVDNSKLSPQEQLDQLTTCMEESLAASMRQTNEEILFQSNIRKQMGQSWAEYACKDTTNVTTTIPIVNDTWAFLPEGSRRSSRLPLNTYFESDHSKVVRAQKFLTFEQCETLEKAAVDGVIPLSARSSSKTAAVDAIAKKVEKLVSDVSGLQASLRKDPLFQVRVRSAEEDTAASSKDCTVGADGSTSCDDEAAALTASPQRIEVTSSNVVATILLICKAPAQGGQIFFPKTGTVMLPKDFVGSAVVILHEIHEEREDDPFVDEYVVCPVTKGKFLAFSDDLAK